MQRFVAVAVVAVGFVVVASLFSPDQSEAADDRHRDWTTEHATTEARSRDTGTEQRGTAALHSDQTASDAHAAADWASEDAHAGLACLGTIEGVTWDVQIYQTALGVRYTVIDRSTGVEHATLITAQQVVEFFPDLPLPAMDLSGEALMLAAPQDHDLPW